MEEQTKEQLLARIRELEAQVRSLSNSIIDRKDEYGLRWIDVPEAFDAESENKIPILEEVKELAIKNDDGKPTHILIEGDNYHALQCLNYTHKGKIDVIYIDPPYNTGKEFVYKDKRVLDKFPDGQTIDNNHPLRHSAWLSFMSKRLELAKNLLSERGVIFISIDDNEQANLKLLCDKVFDEKNFVGQFSIIVKTEGRRYGGVAKTHEYALVYTKNIENIEFNEIEIEGKKFQFSDEFGGFNLQELRNQNARAFNSSNRPNLRYPFYVDMNTSDNNGLCKVYLEKQEGFTEVYPIITNGYESVWRWGRNEKATRQLSDLIARKGTDGIVRIYQKMRKLTEAPKSVLMDKEFISIKGTKELLEIMGSGAFDFPKPLRLISLFIHLASDDNSIILDFFAGSGTTLHATMQLNEEDGGNRQCILVNINEKNICRDVTYERSRRVMQGYTNAKGEQVTGLGNSLKYYKTAFVGNNAAANATDEDKVALAHKAGNLIAIAENTLEEISTTDSYQIFQNDNQYTAIYFSGNLEHFAEYAQKIEALRDSSRLVKVAAYIYCIGNVDVFESEFNKLTRISLHAIPQPIIEIYKQLNA